MSNFARGLWVVALGVCAVASAHPGARQHTALDFLNRYASGEFDAVVSTLRGDIDFADLLNELKRDAPAWIDAAGPAERPRRELVAATFALEAARADAWDEWKWIQMQPKMCAQKTGGECYEPLNVLSWKPPPLLIEWGCKLMSQSETPRPIERWWQLAALSVAQRSEDTAFLVGDPAIGRGRGAGEIINTQDEIKHLDHAQKRFPAESRFMLAQGIARDRVWEADAVQAYLSLMDDPDVAGEAAMRLGALSLRSRRTQQASAMLDRAETLTRDPYVIYLARYFKGRHADQRNDSEVAQDAYRGAIAAWPRGQAATLSLASLLFLDGKRAEAAELTSAMLDAVPPLFDPWREFVHADDRFWPQLVGRLRAEILKRPAGGLPSTMLESGRTAGYDDLDAGDSGDEALELTAQQPPPRQQTFRAATDVVIVDVSVRDGGRVITGLTAEDFVVTDNGVRQTVEAVDATAVPIDATLVVDLSGNDHRGWIPRVRRSQVVHAIQAEVLAVKKLLRPTDRVRGLAIDTYVQQLWPLVQVADMGGAGPFEFGGLASVYDTLASALMQPIEPGRRHVVVARTKGRDSISAIDAARVASLAERPDALFHLVLMEGDADSDDELAQFQATNMGLSFPAQRFWRPHFRRLIGGNPTHELTSEGKIIKSAIEAGGGSWHQSELMSEPSLMGTLRKAFEGFRQSYVLRYTPTGVPRSGWHRISVTVPKARGAAITARRGYGIEERPISPPVRPIPAVPATLEDLTRAFEVGEYQRVVTGLYRTADAARLMREFEAAGNPWPANPRMEAAFVVDLAEPGLFSPRNAVRDQASALLERFAKLVRHPLAPDAFERQWYYAVLTLVQGNLRANLGEAFAARALARFPDEPRFRLARATAADQRSAATAGPTPRPGPHTPAALDSLKTARELYEGLLNLPEVAVEARIRLAHLLHRMGLDDEALARLAEAGAAPIEDPALRYWHQLFRGQVLSALGRPGEAIPAFRAALAQIPSAQSARVSLMNLLFRQGERAEAESLAEQIQKEGSTSTDPWWTYWQGQYRLYPFVVARLRQLAVEVPPR